MSAHQKEELAIQYMKLQESIFIVWFSSKSTGNGTTSQNVNVKRLCITT